MLKKIKAFLHIKENFWLFLLIISGSLTWSLVMFKSGLVFSYGMGFWGPNAHDGVWHIALAKSLAKGSWEMPIFAGEKIKNYHIGFDLILAVIHKITFIPIHNLYFQILPPIFSVLVGVLVYLFVYRWQRSKIKAFWSLFFVYFGGSWGWVISLIRNGRLDGESMFWSQQSISTLLNPPFALSLILIFLGFLCLKIGLDKSDVKFLTVAGFLFGILSQIKVYAGILILLSLFLGGIYDLLKKRSTNLIKVFTSSLVVSILLFPSVDLEAEQLVVFKPFWFLETMMLFPDRLGWTKFGEAMINYKLGAIWSKAILAYVLALLIFLVGNMGTRIVSFFGLLKWISRGKPTPSNYKYIDVLVITMLVLGIFFPLMFVQSGTPWNTIQFFYYALVFSGILAGIVMGESIQHLRSNLMKYFLGISIIFFTIPTTVGTLWFHYLPSRPPAKISNEELEALEFLSKEPDGVVLTLPFDKKYSDAWVVPPLPIYLYESTAYVSAFTGKAVYFEDEVNLRIIGYNFGERRKGVEEFFLNPNADFLRENKITYIYIPKNLIKNSLENIGLEKIFENKEVVIYTNL